MNLDYFRDKLEKLRVETINAIEKSTDTAKPVELDQTMQGRLSRMDAMQQQEMALAGQRRREMLITKIDQALRRIDDGDFGYCLSCDEEISEKRLDLDPTTPICIHCAEGNS